MPAEHAATIQSVERALTLLQQLNHAVVSNVNDLHLATGLPKPTIVRMLNTFVARGIVDRDRNCGGYRLTSLVRSLSQGFRGDLIVVDAGAPILRELTREIKWPANIGTFDRDAMVIRYSTFTESPMSPIYAEHPNRRRALLRGALGRVYLAFCAADERQNIFAYLRNTAGSEGQLEASISHLERNLAQIRERGFAFRDAEIATRNAHMTVAVPVLSETEVLAAIGVTYFRSATNERDVVAELVPRLKEVAAEIALRVSELYSGDQPLDAALSLADANALQDTDQSG